MIIYTNTKKDAQEINDWMKKQEPKYSDDVQISETNEESFGIFKETEKGKYVVYNETE